MWHPALTFLSHDPNNQVLYAPTLVICPIALHLPTIDPHMLTFPITRFFVVLRRRRKLCYSRAKLLSLYYITRLPRIPKNTRGHFVHSHILIIMFICYDDRRSWCKRHKLGRTRLVGVGTK